MGYRLVVALFAITLMCGCDAFDNSSDPYGGDLSSEEIAELGGAKAGKYDGYYSGDMTLDSNTCQAVSDKVGDKVPLVFEVAQVDNIMTFEFDSDVTVGTLDGDKTVVMVSALGVEQIYYLTFAEGKADGNCEVIEVDPNGQYGDPCANYTLSVTKGEKPASKESKKEEETKK